MSKRNSFPPVTVAVLIDGGFFIKRFNSIYNKDKQLPGVKVAEMLYTMALKHVGNTNTLYRIFYYDCLPLDKRGQNPITNRGVDFQKQPEYIFKMDLFNALKRKRKVALRIGTLKWDGGWQLYPRVIKELLKGDKTLNDLQPTDVYPNIRQKGIDMKIGVDITYLALKKLVDTIVLFSGDSDFVPAAKLARREGIDFILDPMGANVEPLLFEHVDGISTKSPFNKNDNQHKNKSEM
jgi:uncharacterized LabA/DUF88 family protein